MSSMSGNGELRGSGTVGKGARRGEAEMFLLGAIVIDESKAAAVRCQARRQRMIGDASTADERHDRADIDQVLGLDAQQMKPHAVLHLTNKRYAGETQKAGWVRCSRKSFQEGRFNKIEVDRRGIDRRLLGLVRWQMRRLPLQRLASGSVVAKRVMIVRPMVMVAVAMAMRMVMIVVHGQKLSGLSMMDLCLPRLPWATIEPSASTTTRTPNRAVMSDVS